MDGSIQWGGDYFADGEVSVTTGFDLETPKTDCWIASNDTEITRAPGLPEEFNGLSGKLKQSWRIVARTTIRNGNQFTVAIDLHGLSEIWFDALAERFGGVKTSP